jgi:cytochrome P450
VTLIFATLKIGAIARVLKECPGLKHVYLWFIPRNLKEKRRVHFNFSVERVTKRFESKSTRPDIWTMVLRNADDGKLSLQEMHSNAALFMGAGTETTATEISGLLYNLATNPDKLEILVKELRREFQHDSDITMERIARLRYLNACVEEGLRVFMPVPIGLPRVNKNGAEVAGVWVPGGVSFHCRQGKLR